ncbi:MAG: right-handed parallel beta-helix repeat-containing protein [Calditrichaeota bacterium]|nr:right-handed parallel beta-helix repeat-containing protein [Calditrichota bacterium]
MKKLHFFIIIIVILWIAVVNAQQSTVSGVITKSATWNGTVYIDGDVTVAEDARLTIEPGTRVLFKPLTDKTGDGIDKTRSELIVYGILIVKGQIENKVHFTSSAAEPKMGDWYGIRLLNPKNMSIIDYAIIEFGYDGISAKKSNPLIRNSRIQLNYNSGIKAELKSEAKIIKNFISENGYAGVITSLGAKPVLTNNFITLNQIGVIALSLSQPNLGNLGTEQKANSGENVIFENIEYDLYNHTNLPILAENNSWGLNTDVNINERIYDGNDEPKYGAVDFTPVSGAATVELSGRILAQENGQTPVDSLNTLVPLPRDSFKTNTQQNTRPAISKTDTPVSESTSVSSEVALNSINTIPRKESTTVPEGSTTFSENSIPASSISSNESNRVNYDQIFLEYFIEQQKAQIIKKAAPQISTPQLGMGAKGRIIVRAIVGKDGKVESAAVIKGLNTYYDKISVEAAMKFRYKVGTIDGIPVRFYTNIFFEF